jgi:cell division septation protein DedD
MAIGGRTLGIVSGLAVGLVVCVFLVVLNPIISKLGDATGTRPIEKLVILSELEKKTDTALPMRSEEDATPETIKKVEIEEITQKEDVAEVVPVPDLRFLSPFLVKPTVSAELETVNLIDPPKINLRTILPADVHGSGEEPLPVLLSLVIIFNEPKVSADSSKSIVLTEPKFSILSPDVPVIKVENTVKLDFSKIVEVEPTLGTKFLWPLIVEPDLTVEIETLDPIEKKIMGRIMILPTDVYALDDEPSPVNPSLSIKIEKLDVSTEPADSFAAVETNVNLDTPEVAKTKILTPGILNVHLLAEVEQANEPSKLVPTKITVASLPKVDNPEASKAALAVVAKEAELKTLGVLGTNRVPITILKVENDHKLITKPIIRPATFQSSNFVQIGFFRVQSNASATVKKMEVNGIPVRVLKSIIKGETFWRVIVGPVLSALEQQKLLQAVKRQGFVDAFLVKG